MTALAADPRPETTSPASGRVNGARPDWLHLTAPLITKPDNKHLSIRVQPIDTLSTDTPTGAHRHPDTPRQTPASVAKAVAPLVVVNALAVYGQLAYALEHIAPTAWPTPARVALSIGFAAAVESVALYVGWHAHDALLLKAHGTARWLRRASFTIAALVGAMNYAHFAAPGFRPTAAACAFGLLSLLSPWMWGLHTRRQQHIQLLKERKVDETGAEFSGARRRAFPIRTWQARRWSIDNNVTDPVAAWAGYKAERLSAAASQQGDTDRPVAPRPTPVAPVDRHPDRTPTARKAATPTAPAKKSAAKKTTPRQVEPTPAPVAPTVEPAAPEPTPPVDGHSPAAVANAAALRERYGDTLPDADNPIRTATGWSVERVKNARAAYAARADIDTSTGAST